MFPPEILSQHLAMLGKTGSGKTSSAKLLIEQVVAGGARVCILDPLKSDWWGLTSSASGKQAGLPFCILGGPRGHVPLHAAAGKAIGEIVGNGKLPLSIIDMADFDIGGPQRFFVDFAQALFRHARGVVYLVIEEAHVFAPKEKFGGKQGNESLSTHCWLNKIATAARSKGIRLVVSTQRTQALHNAVLGSCETLIGHRLTLPADQKPVLEWLRANTDADATRQIGESLSSLKPGEGWICSGEAKIVERRQFPRIKTFDNSATPTDDAAALDVDTAGDRDSVSRVIAEPAPPALDPIAIVNDRHARATYLRRAGEGTAEEEAGQFCSGKVTGTKEWRCVRTAPVDEQKLSAMIGSAVEEAKANDPKELKRKVAELQQQLAKQKPPAGCNTMLQRSRDAAAVDRARQAGVIEGQRQAAAEVKRLRQLLERAGDLLLSIKQRCDKQLELIVGVPAAGSGQTECKSSLQTPVPAKPSREVRPTSFGTQPSNGSSLPPGETAVLSALIQYPHGLRSEQLTVLTGYSRSTRDKYLQRLREREFVTRAGDRHLVTDAGSDALPDAEQLPTGEALQEFWLARLPEGERAILGELLAAYPVAIERDQLSESTGYSRSTRDKYLQRLTAKELVSTGREGVTATGNLFS